MHSFAPFRSERDPGLIIGSGVRVYTWTTFNVEPNGYVEIGDRSIVVGGVFMCAEQITVGRDVLISYHVTIADSDFHPLALEERRADAIANAPDGDRRKRPPLISRPVAIEDGARVGIGAIILKGVTIGAGAYIGAGSVITRNVLPGTAWEGNPARQVGDAGRYA
jgi:acetyltransferase-like isoleucine patch superfamily enzyme